MLELLDVLLKDKKCCAPYTLVGYRLDFPMPKMKANGYVAQKLERCGKN